METAAQNEIHARRIIDALIQQGVDYFCWAPGSRSTPFALAIATHPQARRMIHFDERGLCFHAVGYAKAARKSAVMIATSGTAVGNLLPAVIEASNERIPLILLTADRPPELRDCSANQTCDQVKIFANFVRWYIDLPCPDEHTSEKYLASTISHAVATAKDGPVHINCMLREPLYAKEPVEGRLQRHVRVEHAVPSPSSSAIDYWSKELSKKRQGVILAGSSSPAEPVLALAERLNWPVFPDILSSLRMQHPSLITHFDPILKVKPMAVDAVIQFGDRFVSKTLTQWLEQQSLAFYLHVSEHSMRQDPFHHVTHRVQSCPHLFVDALHLNAHNDEQPWGQWNQLCREKLGELFTELSEPGLMWELSSLLTEEWNLFLGNGMPVRDANQFLLSNCRIFGNRGVSGIDGNIGTAAGIAQATGKPTFAVIGDQAFLHDLNSLAQLTKISVPVVICVVNNGGGGIFSFLPISKRKEAFEEYLAASHNLTFEAAGALFGLPYYHIQTSLREFFAKPHSCIIEITTDRQENVRLHEYIIREIGQCLSSPLEIPVSLH